jgi:hypothetical protein
MTDSEFWSLIKRSCKEAGGKPGRQEVILRKFLRQLSADDVAEFNVRYENLVRKAYQWGLWGAAYVIQGGCSDDMFWDFRSWLVSRGRKVYDAAVNNPDSLARLLCRKDLLGNMSFSNPACYVWEELKGRPVEECPRLGSNLDEKPSGNEWADSDLPRKFPKLWKKFGNK